MLLNFIRDVNILNNILYTLMSRYDPAATKAESQFSQAETVEAYEFMVGG